MYVWTLAQRDRAALRSLLETDRDLVDPWAAEVLEDLRTVGRHQPELEQLGDPEHQAWSWVSYLQRTSKSRWKRLARAILSSKPSVVAAEQKVMNVAQQPSPPQNDESSYRAGTTSIPMRLGQYICPMCPPSAGRCYGTKKGIRSHLFQTHQQIRRARFYVTSDSCPACGKVKASRVAVIDHIHRTRCEDRLTSLAPATTDQLALVDPQAATLRDVVFD